MRKAVPPVHCQGCSASSTQADLAACCGAVPKGQSHCARLCLLSNSSQDLVPSGTSAETAAPRISATRLPQAAWPSQGFLKLGIPAQQLLWRLTISSSLRNCACHQTLWTNRYLPHDLQLYAHSLGWRVDRLSARACPGPVAVQECAHDSR